MPLTTRCRHCGRLFPVYAQQIRERGGKVDCPQCGKRFNAIGGLLDEASPSAQNQQDSRGAMPSPSSAATAPADMLDLQEGHGKAGRMRTALWSLGILILIAALALQVGWWDRGRWLGQPPVQTAVETLCGWIGCRPVLPRLAGTIEILRPALSERGGPPRSLRLTLILVNKASVRQRLPRLQLELYDEKGELAAARRFGPEQYLADADFGSGLAPGKAVRPMLDLEPPRSPAAGFRVKLF